MGFLDDLLDIPRTILGGIIPGLKKDDNDDMKRMMNQQMQAYKDQSELTRKELETKRAETDSQKRRVQEKQIRGLRRNYRQPSGLLGTGKSTPDMSSQLGG